MTPQMLNLQRFSSFSQASACWAHAAPVHPKPEVDFVRLRFRRSPQNRFLRRIGPGFRQQPDPAQRYATRALPTPLWSRPWARRATKILDQQNAAKADLLISWNLITNDKTDVRTSPDPIHGRGVRALRRL